MNFKIWQYLVPVVFLFYAYRLYVKKPCFNDDRAGFPTRRARESEEIWNYVQRTAGKICFFMGLLLIVTSVISYVFFADNEVAYWIHMGIELVCIVVLIPLTNYFTNRKYPEKKGKK